jgi:hypothetical protein
MLGSFQDAGETVAADPGSGASSANACTSAASYLSARNPGRELAFCKQEVTGWIRAAAHPGEAAASRVSGDPESSSQAAFRWRSSVLC